MNNFIKNYIKCPSCNSNDTYIYDHEDLKIDYKGNGCVIMKYCCKNCNTCFFANTNFNYNVIDFDIFRIKSKNTGKK